MSIDSLTDVSRIVGFVFFSGIHTLFFIFLLSFLTLFQFFYLTKVWYTGFILYFAAIYLLYAKLEEEHGLARHAMAVYERACDAVPRPDKFEVYFSFFMSTIMSLIFQFKQYFIFAIIHLLFYFSVVFSLQMYNIYIKRAAEIYGVTQTRSIYEKSIEALPEDQSRQMCIKFADLETKLGEIDRARALYAHCSQICDPRVSCQGLYLICMTYI